jgi:protein-tyrosine kinase
MAMEKAALLREGRDEQVAVFEEEPIRRSVLQAPPVLPVAERLSPSNPFLVNLHDPHSATAEEYRKLKTTLVKMTKADRFRNSIVVTSSLPSEGKSLTSLNLAMSLAQEIDHTVLLVDADLRRPSLHRYLEIEQGPGLADVLLGEADIAQTIVPTGIGKLSIIRAGRQIAQPAELFSSQAMKKLVDELKHRYQDRYLIFDTPPVLPFAETRSLAQLVDGVLFVVMERLAPEENVRDALESLKGCQMLGLVYNAATLSGSDDRYSYSYYSKPKPAKSSLFSIRGKGGINKRES